MVCQGNSDGIDDVGNISVGGGCGNPASGNPGRDLRGLDPCGALQQLHGYKWSEVARCRGVPAGGDVIKVCLVAGTAYAAAGTACAGAGRHCRWHVQCRAVQAGFAGGSAVQCSSAVQPLAGVSFPLSCDIFSPATHWHVAMQGAMAAPLFRDIVGLGL